MAASYQAFFKQCASIDFGRIPLTVEQQKFYQLINDRIIDLCRSLPKSTRIRATHFLLQYAGLSIGDKLDFFRRYHVPAWSILYWIRDLRSDPGNMPDNVVDCMITIHSMAMLLHSLDDHLSDGELAPDHILLLLRSQSWHHMQQAIVSLDRRIDGGSSRASLAIDRYYAAIQSANSPGSIEDYCIRFEDQMQTGLVAPQLMLSCLETPQELKTGILQAYCHFGVAWRLLDDIQDIEEDLQKRVHSAVYVSLPEDVQNIWDQPNPADKDGAGGRIEKIYKIIQDKKIIAVLVGRIIKELETATALVEQSNLPGLVTEFQGLLVPLREAYTDHG